MFKWLVLWFSFSGAMFFDYRVPEKALLEEYGKGTQVPLRTSQTYVLTSWNVYKGGMEGMHTDLAQIINESDFVHVQEFFLDEAQKQQVAAFHNFRWDFAKSFQDNSDWTGVALISRWEPFDVVAVRSQDGQPFTNTPKMSLISKFKIADGRELWLANIHSLNFNLDHSAFKRQLDALLRELSVHNGPLILSGDFNTWAWPRMEYLLTKTYALGLERALLESPVGFLGTTMDHIFYRGVGNVKGSVMDAIQTSDHLPLRLEFTL